MRFEVSDEAVTGDSRDEREIDWDAYASQYDFLATHNPSYRENIEILRSLIGALGLPDEPTICDIGAGTGNYICALAQDLPNASFVHLDADEAMNEVAREKYTAADVPNVDIHCCTAPEARYPEESFDMILCVNALYAIQPRAEFLARVREWLKPDGIFFVIDFGRKFNTFDWAAYIFGHVLRERGVRGLLRFLREGAEAIRQNRRGKEGQAKGLYWLHSTDEFADALRQAGFQVDHLQKCYREYCDLAICRKD